MIKMRAIDNPTAEDSARAMAEYLRDFGKSSLKSGRPMHGLDRAAILHSTEGVQANFEALVRFIAEGEAKERVKESAFEVLHQLMAQAFFVGLSGILTEEARAHLAKLQALQARNARKEKDSAQENALRSAIREVRGDGPEPHPSKEALAILEGVNARLLAAGFDSVKVDVVRRRLERIPRS